MLDALIVCVCVIGGVANTTAHVHSRYIYLCTCRPKIERVALSTRMQASFNNLRISGHKTCRHCLQGRRGTSGFDAGGGEIDRVATLKK